MQPIRLCQLITELHPGGAERCVYELATRLDRGLFDVQVAALRGGQMAEELASAGVKVTVLGVGCRWSPTVFGKLHSLTGLLKRERIDLLHTHLFHADLAGRLAARRAQVPHVIHTVHVAERRFRPWQFLFVRSTGRSDRIIAVSQSVKDWHRARTGLAEDQYTVIPNGIDTEAYWRDMEAGQVLRRQWGAESADVIAVFVGRLDRQKGIDVLLRAAGLFLVTSPQVRLVIAGDGPMQRRVQRFCQAAGGRATYLGFVHDIRGLLSAADMFVLPSRWEGWPLALGEAMAVGLPAVGADAPGIRDVIEHDRTGLLVPPEDPAALAEAMAKLAGDTEQRRRMGEAGRQLICNDFTIGKYISSHTLLYQAVISGR